MASTGRNPTGVQASDRARLGTDPELLSALLEAHEQFGLSDLLGVLLARAVAWSGGVEGLAIGPGAERGQVVVQASSESLSDARSAAIGGLEAKRLREASSELAVFEGLGPLAPGLVDWPGGGPGGSALLPVCDPGGRWAATLWVLFEGSPPVETLAQPQALVALAAPAVYNALQVEAMRDLVIKDDTAQCFNRRHFESCLPEELSRAGRFHAPLSLIFLDMDNLKSVNQLHGHAMGSRTLFEVSRRVRTKIRRFDKLFRFGGDEFCILLPETEWHGALEVAERVRDAIASRPFLVRELEGPEGVRMTASLGIASYPLHARTPVDLVQHADRAMQRIKSGTKNSIGIAEIVGDEHE